MTTTGRKTMKIRRARKPTPMIDHAIVREILGDTGNEVSRAFRLMGICEEEIAAMMVRYPERCDVVHARGFMACLPNDLKSAGDRLYRIHCREILERIARDERIQPGTDAELMFCFMRASLAAPPNREHAQAYMRLFVRHFPEHAEETRASFDLERERIPGEVDRIIADLRTRIGRVVRRTA